MSKTGSLRAAWQEADEDIVARDDDGGSKKMQRAYEGEAFTKL
jgi:hypothetical protein